MPQKKGILTGMLTKYQTLGAGWGYQEGKLIGVILMLKHNSSGLKPMLRRLRALVVTFALLLAASCSQQFTVSLNNQAVFDPNSRLPNSEAVNPDLQGCINLAMRQQMVTSVNEVTVLSCASSEIDSLVNIGQLTQLRFLDLGDNAISNITPLENLLMLGGLNLNNNVILDISVLQNLPSLVSVSLAGNPNIPCDQLTQLRTKLGENLSAPATCKN